VSGQKFGSVTEHPFRCRPTETGVRDADSIAEVAGVGKGLGSFLEMAFEHDTDQWGAAFGALGDEILPDGLLTSVLFT
jgi:hypothetical protein